jgi:hypothetical protein
MKTGLGLRHCRLTISPLHMVSRIRDAVRFTAALPDSPHPLCKARYCAKLWPHLTGLRVSGVFEPPRHRHS